MGDVGLTLRAHPVSFPREELVRRRMVTCAEAGVALDGHRCTVAGLVLMRQKPVGRRGPQAGSGDGRFEGGDACADEEGEGCGHEIPSGVRRR